MNSGDPLWWRGRLDHAFRKSWPRRPRHKQVPLRIAILTVDIGTGLGIDARLLADVLRKLGHTGEIGDLRSESKEHKPADCSIFLERYDPRFAGRFNVMIANPEWGR